MHNFSFVPFDLKYAPGSCAAQLLKSGVQSKGAKAFTSKHENSSFAKSHFESRKEVCMAIICLFIEVYLNIAFLCNHRPP